MSPVRIYPYQVVLIFCLFYLSAILIHYDFDLKAFVKEGDCFSDCDGISQKPCRKGCEEENDCTKGCIKCEAGYDGQFVYYIARDPDGAEPCIDVPAYRYQRILLPLVGRFFALGNTEVLPLVLVLLNLLALVGSTYLVELLLVALRVSRWFALTYGLFVGMVISVRVSTTEPLAYGLVVLAIWLFQQKPERVWSPALVLLAAALTKEVTGLFVAGFVLYFFLQRRRQDAALLSGIVGIPFLVWQIYLYQRFGEFGISSGGANATGFEIIPYMGVWRIAIDGNFMTFLILAGLLIIPIAVLPSLWALYQTMHRLWLDRQEAHLYTCLFFANTAIMPFVPLTTYAEPLGITRFMVGLVMMHILFTARYFAGRRVLLYSTLWILLLFFLASDFF